jgi:hypothetical protein
MVELVARRRNFQQRRSFGPTHIEKQIMLNDDIGGSERTSCPRQLDRGRIRVLRVLRTGAGDVFVSHAWASASRLRAANDNQLAWPYLAFADDWFASC